VSIPLTKTHTHTHTYAQTQSLYQCIMKCI